jgi:type 1 glutamine amidotransferase
MQTSLLVRTLCLLLAALTSYAPVALAQEAAPKPLKALLIAGGCCHDYAKQQLAISQGIQARANVQVDVYWTDNSTTSPVLPLYQDANWAKQYDVIIHDECASDIKDPAIVDRILQVHQEIPAVHLHCAMHSFRTGGDAWFKHLGIQSSGHGPQEPIAIHFVDSQHPITETLHDWTTIREELYNNVKVLDAHALAVGKQNVGDHDEEAIVVWTNESQGARSFSTTIGHNTETVEDERYLELITRGLLWACDKLNPEYLTPFQGKNTTTFIDKNVVK